MVQNLFDPRRLNPLLAVLVVAILIAHATGVATPWVAQATAPAVAASPSATGPASVPAALAQIAEAQRLARALRAHLVAAVTTNDANTSRRQLELAGATLADSERVVRELTALENAAHDSLVAQLALTQSRLAVDGVAPVVAALNTGNMEAARRLVLERMLERVAAHEDVLQAVIGQHHERMAAGYQQAQSAAQNVYFAAVLVCLMAIAGTAAYAFYVRRRIIGPVELLGHVMRVVSEDQNYTHRAHASGHPAVVRLAGAFDRMMAGIQVTSGCGAGHAPEVAPAEAATIARGAVQPVGAAGLKLSMTEVPVELPAGRCAA